MNIVNSGSGSAAGDLAPEVNIHFRAFLEVSMVVEAYERVAIIKPTQCPQHAGQTACLSGQVRRPRPSHAMV